MRNASHTLSMSSFAIAADRLKRRRSVPGGTVGAYRQYFYTAPASRCDKSTA